jgi:peptidoglycan hydrolase CwlO-like protein
MQVVMVGTAALLLWSSAAVVFSAETEAERKARLEAALQEVEAQIETQQVLVESKQQERQSLERDINLLDAEIEKAKLGIQARAYTIEQLSDQIDDKEGVIAELNDRLRRQRQSLAQLLRNTQEIDDYTLAEILLSNENFSYFFDDLERFQSIKEKLNESVGILRQIRGDTEEQIESLEERQLTEAEQKRLQEQEKQAIEQKETEKEQILEVTKGEEALYQALLEQTQKTAAQIRAQLFELSGGGGPIPFPEAVALASVASEQTGVATALILAILEQESAYGANIGGCVYDDVVHGRAVMHPDRDQPVFTALADVLGFDPRSQQISCPWIRSGERVGWGGAMGPSQFIPSTWAHYGGLVETGSGWTYQKGVDYIRKLTGKDAPSSPFNNQDAFMATALLMRDNGAGGGTYKTEWTAAIRYFAGWNGASNPINYPYGDNVMSRRARLQGEINVLRGG